MKYEQYESPMGSSFIKRDNEDGTTSFIPKDETNSDYQAYLRWLKNPDAEEGGTL